MAELDDYAWLTGDDGALWLARVAQETRTELQILDALRRDLPAERARLVVEQVDLRRRAVEKFGDLAASMFFTRVHLEQATDVWVARYKAQRLAAEGGPTCDFCCGIGGDLLALAERRPATGWDLSPIACQLAQANVGGRGVVQCRDVETLTPEVGGAWHLDPDRRPTGRRTTTIADYAPGPALVERWRQSDPCGAVKLAPAAEVPVDWAAGAELEWITRDRECRQQVAWFGVPGATAGSRRATVVGHEGQPVTFTGDAEVLCDSTEEPGRVLYDPDPSILAAGLLGALAEAHALTSLGAGGAYLTGDAAVAVPLATALVVQECLPLRPATLAKYFAERAVGTLEIKKRGVTIDPEVLRRQLKLRGDNAATLVLTRIGRREVAIVADRLTA